MPYIRNESFYIIGGILCLMALLTPSKLTLWEKEIPMAFYSYDIVSFEDITF